MKNKITNKEKCTNCIHKKVCSIYEFAKKHNENSLCRFPSSSMNDVCGQYLREGFE